MSAKSFYFECKKSEDDDRSSASSIPWNSDSIKQNKRLWEKIERLLSKEEEALPDEEPELIQEILDWQRKFPKLTKRQSNLSWQQTNQSTFNTSSTNVSEIPELNSLSDENDGNDSEVLFESPKTHLKTKQYSDTNRKDGEERLELADFFGKELHITPLTLQQRKNGRFLEQRNLSATSSILSDSPVPVKTSRYKNISKGGLNSQMFNTNSRLQMPPILNVLDSKRRFYGNSGNRSFVQLTQVQQAKSAAVHSRQPPVERQFRVWNKPLASVSVVNSNFSSRYLNNRNAIILPALRHEMTPTTNFSNQSTQRNNSSRQFNSFSTSNSSLSSAHARSRQRIHSLSNNQATTSTSGRSISAVHGPMHLHGTFYHL